MCCSTDVGILTTKSGGTARNYHFGECVNAAVDRLDIGTSDSSYTRMTEALRSLHDDPEMQDVVSTPRQEIALNGTHLRDVILSGFDAFSPHDFLEVTDVNARTIDQPAKPSSTPGFFVHHYDMMSWAFRYNRDNPLKKAGDPEILLNSSQIRAIAQMLSERISVVQGVSTSLSFSGFHSYATSILASRNRKDADNRRSGPITQEALQSASPDPGLHLYQRRCGQSGRGSCEGWTATTSYLSRWQSERDSSTVLA